MSEKGKPAFILTADWHLADRKWKDRKDLRGDSYDSLFQVLNAASVEKLDIIAAGDLFDRKTFTADVLGNTVKAFKKAVTENSTNDLYYIQGNHDIQQEHWCEVINECSTQWNFEHLCRINYPVTVETNDTAGNKLNVNIFGFDYMPKSILDSWLCAIVKHSRPNKNFNILVLHQTYVGFMGKLGDDVTWIPANIDFVLIGDYHEYRYEMITLSDGREIPILSPGSICMQNIGEPEDKYFAYLYLDKQGDKIVPYIERKKLDTRQVIRYKLDKFEDIAPLYEGLEKYSEELKETPPRMSPIIQIQYNHDVISSKELDRFYLLANKGNFGDCVFHLFLKQYSHSDNSNTVKVAKVLEELCDDPLQSLISCLPDVVNREEDEELFDFVSNLIQSDQPDMVVYDKKQEITGM